MQAILHNVRSIHNVASIFRTADGLGVSKLFLSGYTPTPVDRFGRQRQKFSKVALGAEKAVDWESVDNINKIIENLQKENRLVIACEPIDGAKDYRDFKTDKPVCLVLGNEPNGLSKELIDVCDDVVEIPMQGVKSSLNVSVAFGILTATFMHSC